MVEAEVVEADRARVDKGVGDKELVWAGFCLFLLDDEDKDALLEPEPEVDLLEDLVALSVSPLMSQWMVSHSWAFLWSSGRLVRQPPLRISVLS